MSRKRKKDSSREQTVRERCIEYLSMVWKNLIPVKKVVPFSRWLAKRGEWIIQSPDEGEVLRVWRTGETLVLKYDGRSTFCKSHLHTLWLTYEAFGEEQEHEVIREEHQRACPL